MKLIMLLYVAAHAAGLQGMLDKFNPDWIDSAPKRGPGPNADRAGIGQNGQGTPPQVLPYWLPFCFFADANTPAAAVNEKIKRLADEYAKCGVVVEPFAFTLRPNYPQDPQQLSALARQACNIEGAFGTRGAVQIDVSSKNIPARMCNDPAATGCSTLCERISVSLVAPGTPPVIGLHESMHSNCCGRLCVNKGEGSEPGGPDIDLAQISPREFHAETGRNISEEQITEPACASIRAGAAANDGGHAWRPNKQRYYAAATDPAKQIDLNRGRSIFPPRGAPKEGPPESNDDKIAEAHEDTGGPGGASPAPAAQADAGAYSQFTNGKPAGDGQLTRKLTTIGFDDNAAKSRPGGTSKSGALSVKLAGEKEVPQIAADSGDKIVAVGARDDFDEKLDALGLKPFDPREAKIGFDDDASRGMKARPNKKKRKRGATLKKEKFFQSRNDTLISTRPAPDFQVEGPYDSGDF